MIFKKLILLGTFTTMLSSCALWPYKKDFDCPTKEGLKCKSLYDISEMADKGMFGPDAKKPENREKHSHKNPKKKVGYCRAI